MPPLLRAFSILFIGAPGALIWIYGALFTAGTIPSILNSGIRGQHWPILLTAALGVAGVPLGYLMIIGNRILCKDPRERFAGRRFTERVLWNLAMQFSAILAISSVMAAINGFETAGWDATLAPLLLMFIFAFTWLKCGRHWHRLRRAWREEIVADETARAMLDFHPPRRDNR
jgi:hypothetical protein